MNTNMISMVVGVMVVISLVQSFQINTLKKEVVPGTAGGSVDQRGWTEDEKMMYEHHGTLPARLQKGGQQAPQTQMVGGC